MSYEVEGFIGEDQVAIKELKADTKPASLIYCGPNLPRGILNQFTVYRGGLPKHLEDHFEKCPAIVNLFVPVDKLPKTMEAINKSGTAQSLWFKRVQEYIRGGVK